MDFTDPAKPFEIAYFDRGPIDAKSLVMGGSWSAYWYNGRIYSSEIARGLDILELVPTKHLSKNEIEAAKSVKLAELNVQDQKKFAWKNKAAVARAYVDQLERAKTFSASQIAELRTAIDKAEGSSLAATELNKIVAMLESRSATTSDSSRFQGIIAALQ
jgi:hypothetical protein